MCKTTTRSAQCREKGRDMMQEDADKMQSMVWEKAGKECDLRTLVEAKKKSVYADREACLLAAWQRNISISPIVSNNEQNFCRNIRSLGRTPQLPVYNQNFLWFLVRGTLTLACCEEGSGHSLPVATHDEH